MAVPARTCEELHGSVGTVAGADGVSLSRFFNKSFRAGCPLFLSDAVAADACISALLSLTVVKPYGPLLQTILVKVAQEDRCRR